MTEKDDAYSNFSKTQKWFSIIVAGLALVAIIYLAFKFLSSDDRKTSLPSEQTIQKENGVKKNPIRDLAVPQSLYQGPEAFQFSHKSHNYTAFVFNSTKHEIQFSHSGKGSINLEEVAINKELLFATNAGIFNEDYQAVGLYVSKGEVISTLNTKDGNGNFFLKPNGVFFQLKDGKLGIAESTNFQKNSFDILNATQSGPLLLLQGEVHPAFNEGSPNRFVRSGVGIISPVEAVFILSEESINFYDFAMAFKDEFDCKNALYLDGAISEIYLPELDKAAGNQPFSSIISIAPK